MPDVPRPRQKPVLPDSQATGELEGLVKRFMAGQQARKSQGLPTQTDYGEFLREQGFEHPSGAGDGRKYTGVDGATRLASGNKPYLLVNYSDSPTERRYGSVADALRAGRDLDQFQLLNSMTGEVIAEPGDRGVRIYEPVGEGEVVAPPQAKPGYRGLVNDPLMNAVRFVESRGRNDAISPVGARGPYQIMPATAKHFGVDDPELLHDPKIARPLARRILEDYISQFDGDLERGLAAYNAGPGRVRRAIRKGGQNWRKYLPSETQSYLEKIRRAQQQAGG